LIGAHLVDARLTRADLRGCLLNEADLRKAELWHANLEGAFLPDANLGEANLLAANLWKAYLKNADVAGAQYDRFTKWPSGFDPAAGGAIGPPEKTIGVS
jgi:uncharacterized protein YjbI with pentapeptide repeats